EGVPEVGDMSIHRDGGAPLGPREDRHAVCRDDWAVGAIVLVERVLERPNAKRSLSPKQVILRLRGLEDAAEMEEEKEKQPRQQHHWGDDLLYEAVDMDVEPIVGIAYLDHQWHLPRWRVAVGQGYRAHLRSNARPALAGVVGRVGG